uniref:Uncharacterized protein n=1 Tax=Triticum urartu TaxID=4572 RepID=A0A8R7P0E1_TRIUA
ACGRSSPAPPFFRRVREATGERLRETAPAPPFFHRVREATGERLRETARPLLPPPVHPSMLCAHLHILMSSSTTSGFTSVKC